MKIRSVEFVKSGTHPEHYPEPLPELAFCGRSNVGKSSLLNSLIERKKLVKTSSKPGHTRLLNWFKVNDRLLLCDLPGYGYARVAPTEQRAWAAMIERYLAERESLLGLIILVDVRRGIQQEEIDLIRACITYQLQPILVGTKIDKLKSNALTTQKRAIGKKSGLDIQRDIIWYSAVTHHGREQLWKRINALIPELVETHIDLPLDREEHEEEGEDA